MIDEKRTDVMNLRVRPSIRASIEADRRAKGQPLVEWAERAFVTALTGSEENEQQERG